MIESPLSVEKDSAIFTWSQKNESLLYQGFIVRLPWQKGREGNCACETESDAKAMLSRAIPYRDFSAEEYAALPGEFSALCQESYVEAVTALMSSIAVAKRN